MSYIVYSHFIIRTKPIVTLNLIYGHICFAHLLQVRHFFKCFTQMHHHVYNQNIHFVVWFNVNLNRSTTILVEQIEQ